MLTGDELWRRLVVLLADPALAHEHIQPNGVDLSLDAVWRFAAAGALGRASGERSLPERQPLPFDANGWLALEGGTYGVRYAERVEVPPDCGGLCFPRSSLLRMGLHVPTAVVGNPHGVRLQRGARIAQLVLFRLTEAASATYSGHYQDPRAAPEACSGC